MLVLGLQGSPRRRGNTHFLVSSFLAEAERLGARTRLLEVDRMHVVPCKEYVVCEKRGFCPIEDDVKTEVYPLLREADFVVVGTPVFFYNMTAQLKAVVDRCQVFWARKYRFRLRDPKHQKKEGILLSMAATRGKKLFDAIHLTVKNFFDALDIAYAEALTYREIEGPKDMKAHPSVEGDVRKLAERLIAPYLARRRVLFVGRTDSGASQMAAALAQDRFGDRFDIASAGVDEANELETAMVEAMAEAGLDVAFRRPVTLSEMLEPFSPELCVAVENLSWEPQPGQTEWRHWDLDPNQPMGAQREALERRVRDLFTGLVG